MRKILALVSLALGAALMVVGLGFRTFLADPSRVTAETRAVAQSPYAMMTAAELAKVPGTPTVTVAGKHTVLVYGSQKDVRAWLAPFGYEQIRYDTESKSLKTARVAKAKDDSGETQGEGDNAQTVKEDWLTPLGSDLWIDEKPAGSKAGVSERIQLKPGQAMLIATSEKGKIGHPVSITWHRTVNTPLAGPFLVGGAVLALVGVILYILAIDHDKRGLGPRRGRRGVLLGLRDSVKRREKVDPIHPGRGKSASGETGGGDAADAAGAQGAAGAKGIAGAESVAGAQGTPAKHNETTLESRAARRRVRLGGLALLGAASLVLTGCSPSYWPDFSRKPHADQSHSASAAASPVTEKQLERIVHGIAEVSLEGDRALDPGPLEKRFQGAALTQRAANYKIRKAEKDYKVVPPYILDKRLGYELIQSTTEWPRTIFVAVASSATEPVTAGEDDSDSKDEKPAKDNDSATNTEKEAASPTLGLLIQQRNPHENYKVSQIFNLRGGIEMPPAAPAEEGTAVLDNNIETLALSPSKVGEQYAAILNQGAESEAAKAFNLKDDKIIERGGIQWVKAEQKNLESQEGKATFSSSSAPSDTPPIALSTGAGGALVCLTITEARTTKAESRSELPVGGVVKAISGLSGKKGKIVQKVEHQLLFYVPSTSSKQQIQLLGSSSELVGASE